MDAPELNEDKTLVLSAKRIYSIDNPTEFLRVNVKKIWIYEYIGTIYTKYELR